MQAWTLLIGGFFVLPWKWSMAESSTAVSPTAGWSGFFTFTSPGPLKPTESLRGIQKGREASLMTLKLYWLWRKTATFCHPAGGLQQAIISLLQNTTCASSSAASCIHLPLCCLNFAMWKQAMALSLVSQIHTTPGWKGPWGSLCTSSHNRGWVGSSES